MNKIKNAYLRFLVKQLIVLSIVIVIDQITGAILSKFYYKQSSGLFYRTTYVMDSTTADVIVFGSSRANHHYVPQIFEDSLHLTFYNAGRDGNFMLFNYATFKSLTKRYTPKIVIFDVNPFDIIKNELGYERLSSLLPYYKTHPEVRSIVKLRSPFEKWKLLSAVYPYNSSLLTILVGNMEMNKKRKGDDRGYVPVYGKMDSEPILEKYDNSFELDSLSIGYLSEIASICKQKGIQLYLVYSPIYFTTQSTTIDSVFNEIASKHGFKYVNYSQDSHFSMRKGFFKDIAHLNHQGAELFSSIIAGELKDNQLE